MHQGKRNKISAWTTNIVNISYLTALCNIAKETFQVFKYEYKIEV